MYVKLLPYLYPWNGTTQTWGSAVLIDDAYGISVDTNLGSLNDSWSFKIPNVRDGRVDNFNPQDRVEIFLSVNGLTATTDNLIMNGLVKTIQEDVNNYKTLRVEGRSFGEVCTNGLVFIGREAQSNLNVMEFLDAARTSVQLFDSNFNITAFDAPAFKKDGVTPFPVINSGGQINEFNVSLASLLDKYLTDSYTEDGRYYWYVNNSRTLVIRPRLGSTITSVLTEGVDFKTARYRINTDDVRNYIVVKCGSDAYGKKITTKYDDVVSRAKYGFKYYLLVEETIAGTLVERNATTNSLLPASSSGTASWGEAYSTYADYNSKLRAKAKSEGQAKGQAFAVLHNKGLKEVTLTMAPTVAYQIGDYVSITAPSYNLTAQPMRVKSVSWNINDTTVTLVEEVTV